MIFLILGAYVFKRSRKDVSLDGEISVWSIGSSLSCKEGEFRKFGLSIKSIVEMFD